MAQRNPSTDKSNKGLNTVFEGIDNLPNPTGINQDALSQANEMPGHGALGVKVSMTPNDGDLPSIADAPFANGTDRRHFESTGGADPTPAMPGA